LALAATFLQLLFSATFLTAGFLPATFLAAGFLAATFWQQAFSRYFLATGF
jgi:hypothetical protein